MQRKKKVETYDGDLDFFAPAVVPPPQPVPTVSSSQVQNGVDYVHAGAASPQAPAPAIAMPYSQAGVSTTRQVAPQVSSGYHPVSSPPPLSHVAPAPAETSYNAWEAEQPAAPVIAELNFTDYRLGVPPTTNEYDHQQLSPIAVPTHLRPISKGIKRSPSAGIISALAAAESMARAGSSTNASASPAPSVSGDRMPSGGLPSMGSLHAGSSNALPTLPAASAAAPVVEVPAAVPVPAFVEAPATEPEYVATSFAVCSAPLFSAADDQPSEFDVLADTADALDSFNLDDDMHTNGADSAWVPPAQEPWQETQIEPERPPSAAPHSIPAVSEEPVASQYVASVAPPPTSHHEYQFTASPSPSPIPPQFQQQSGGDDDFFAQIGDDIGTGVVEEQQEESAFDAVTEVAEPVDASFMSEEQQVETQQEEVAAEVPPVDVDVAAEDEQGAPEVAIPTSNTEHTPGSTWYDDAGYCYYLSEDGWKYFWDATTQQWAAHEYVGVSGTSGVDTKSIDGLTDTNTVVEHQEHEEDVINTEFEAAPAPEASFSEFAIGGGGDSSVAVAEEKEEDSGIADWDTSGNEAQSNSNAQYTNYYEQQQQQQHHNSFLPQQQAVDAHTTPPPMSSPSPATFVPSAQHTAQEPVAMQPSPYLQPNTAAWGATATTASPPRQLHPQHHQHQHQHYHHQHSAPQQYSHQQRSLHPSCGFAKFAFGGRLVRVSPSGTITTHLMSALPEDVVRPIGSAAGTVSITSRKEMLSAFPGPLGTSLNKEKAAAFFAARKEACVGEEPGGDAAALHTLWSVLEAQALHPPTKTQTNASPQVTNGKETTSHAGSNGAVGTHGADAALAAALRQHEGSGGSATASIMTTHTHAAAAPSPAALQSIQDLVLHGRKAEAVQAAVQYHAWPLALILSRSLGPAEWQSTVESYTAASLSSASPLSTVCMLTSGAGVRAIPDPTTNPTAAAQVMQTWRQHAAALAVCHNQGAELALEALGEALLARGCVAQAHTCFVLAGVPLQASDQTTTNAQQQQQNHQHQFAVVGASRTLAPRTYAALPAILRTEMFTWSRTVGNTQAVPNFLWVLPYKLLHAYALAEMGLLSQSAQYCSSILTTLQGLGNKVPPGLAVCRASTADLNERLQHLAAARKVSLAGAQFNAGAIVSSVGKLLDRGISALMGIERQHSRSSSFTTDIGGVAVGGGAGSALAGHSRRSSVTTVPSSPLKMPTGAATAAGAQHGGEESHMQPPKLLSSFMSRVASFTSVVTPEPTATASAEPGEPENAFYYDNELKIWRERGKPPPPPVEEPPPPPTAASWQTPPPPSSSATATGPPTGNHAMQSPLMMQQQHGASAGGGGGVSRYAMAPIGAGIASSPPQTSSLLPTVPSSGATFKPFNPAAAAVGAGAGGAASFGAPATFPPMGGGQTAPGAAHHPAQFVPQQQSLHNTTAAGYYGQSAMEEMSEVEL